MLFAFVALLDLAGPNSCLCCLSAARVESAFLGFRVLGFALSAAGAIAPIQGFAFWGLRSLLAARDLWSFFFGCVCRFCCAPGLISASVPFLRSDCVLGDAGGFVCWCQERAFLRSSVSARFSGKGTVDLMFPAVCILLCLPFLIGLLVLFRMVAFSLFYFPYLLCAIPTLSIWLNSRDPGQ